MLITASDVSARFRSDVADAREGTDAVPDSNSLWKDWEIYDYLNEALERWAQETEALFAQRSFAVVANTPTVSLPQGSRVYDVRRARLSSSKTPLREYNIDAAGLYISDDYGLFSQTIPGWENSSGTPTHYNLRSTRDAIRLAPIPAAADTLLLDCTLLPSQIYEGMPLPIRERKDRHLLLLWMKKLAYAKQDADTFDLTRSQQFGNEFEVAVVERRYELQRNNQAPRTVMCNW